MATKEAIQRKMSKVFGEYDAGELNIGKSSKKVTSRPQAVAIALSIKRKMQSK